MSDPRPHANGSVFSSGNAGSPAGSETRRDLAQFDIVALFRVRIVGRVWLTDSVQESKVIATQWLSSRIVIGLRPHSAQVFHGQHREPVFHQLLAQLLNLWLQSVGAALRIHHVQRDDHVDGRHPNRNTRAKGQRKAPLFGMVLTDIAQKSRTSVHSLAEFLGKAGTHRFVDTELLQAVGRERDISIDLAPR